MNKFRLMIILTLLVAIFMTFSFATATNESGFGLTWWTVDGGGGTSVSSSYTLSGSIGQADAGTLVGGTYAINGGFWGAAVPQSSHLLFLPVIAR